MEETIINEPSLFQTLVSSPTTYIVLLIIVLTVVGLKKGKSSPKCCEWNKTSTPTKPPVAKKPVAKKPVMKKPVAKKNTSKKPVAKKMPKKKATAKRTPKKSGK